MSVATEPPGDRDPTGYASFVEFYRDGPYARFPQEHRAGGSLEVRMLDVRQGAVEATDPAMPQWCFTGLRETDASGLSHEMDFGDGWRRHSPVRGIVDPQPADTECRFRLPGMHLLVMTIDRDRLAGRLDEVGTDLAALEPLCNTAAVMPEALALMERAWAAMRETGPAANLIVDGALSGVVGLMLARAGRLPALPPRLDDRRLQRVIDYVEARLGEPITAGALAAVAQVSLFHFTRLFRDATGRTPHAYLQARRVERAKAALADPDRPLAEVAFAHGFASQSHFTRVFKAACGLAPGAYRAELRR